LRFGPGESEFLRLEWADKAEIECLIMFQPGAMYDVHRSFEETCYKFFNADMVPQSHPRLRREFDHDVDVAFRAIVAPCRRAEQGGMRDAALAQGGLELLNLARISSRLIAREYSTRRSPAEPSALLCTATERGIIAPL
jgi:hypothetical protein